MPPPSKVQLDLLRQLEADGVLTPEAAHAARERYISTDRDPPSAAARATALLTLSNAAKALGIAALLLALAAFIDLISPWLARAPIEAYQLPMLAVATGATLRPDLVWRAQAPYVAILATSSTYIILVWMLMSHPACLTWLDRLDNAGWPTASLLGAASLALFAAAAAMHESQILAVAAAGCFTWVLAAADFEVFEDVLWLSVAGHCAAVAAYISIKARGRHPGLVYLCTYAVEYYCTSALAVLLWIGTTDPAIGLAFMFTAVFVAVGAAACVVYYHLAIRTPASIFACAAVPVMLSWVSRLMDTLGAVVTLTLCGAVLFGSGLLLDRHRRLLVFDAPQRRGAPGAGGGDPEADSAMVMPTLLEGSTGHSADVVPLMGSDEAC